MHNPFLSTPASLPGHGTAHLALIPPSTPVLQTLTYQYPLKLISPAPLTITSKAPPASAAASDKRTEWLVHTLYTLTYGGGLVAGDAITLSVILAPLARLIVLTQGSTKIFKSPDRDTVSRQDMRVEVQPGAALCFLPDPVQPFERSCFAQNMIYEVVVPEDVEPSDGGDGAEGKKRSEKGSLCVLDWVSRGRAARGEEWGFWKYGSRNEIYLVSESEGRGDQEKTEGAHEKQKRRRLLLRDNLVLDVDADEQDVGSIAARMDGRGVFGTLILYGPLFEKLGRFFMDEFKATPRIGGRKWDSGSGDEEEITELDIWRRTRRAQEDSNGLLWTAAAIRGCVVVKFGAKEVEGGRQWLRSMLEQEGTVVDQFGERVLLCLR